MKKIPAALLLILAALAVSSSLAAAAAAPRVYLNDTSIYLNKVRDVNLTLSTNISSDGIINHTFKGRSTESNSKWDVEYRATNSSSFLFKFRVDDNTLAGPDLVGGDQILSFSCDGNTGPTICGPNCNGINFGQFNTFTVAIIPSQSIATITVNGIQVGNAGLCNLSQIDTIRFSPLTPTISKFDINTSLLIADNLPPTAQSGIQNLTWPEDTNTSINISGNFSDPNGDTLTYGFASQPGNITISMDKISGIVNFTPSRNFFGVRNATFFANDSDNITYSNIVFLNITPVNDPPSVSSALISSTDFMNRTNGTLAASWAFSDPDGDSPSFNETMWYVNGTRIVALNNLTSVSSQNTSKAQSWIFSVRAGDGTITTEFINSSNMTIQNALQFFSPALENISVEANQPLFYDTNYTDIDGDNVTFHDNSSLFNISSQGIISFTPSSAGNFTINITMSEGNNNVSGVMRIEVTPDITLPVITSINTSASGTSTVTVNLSATTGETAECRFSTSDLNYTNMTLMSSTNSTSHSNLQSFTSDSSGTYYVRCSDPSGNAMNYSNSTAYNADVQEPTPVPSGSSSSGSSGSSGGGSGNSGYTCTLDWQCSSWAACENGMQARKCTLVEVTPRILNSCPSRENPPTAERECLENIISEEMPADEIPETGQQDIQESPGSAALPITGAAISGNNYAGSTLIAILIIIVLSSSIYFGRKSKFFRKQELSKEEMEKLEKMIKEAEEEV